MRRVRLKPVNTGSHKHVTKTLKIFFESIIFSIIGFYIDFVKSLVVMP